MQGTAGRRVCVKTGLFIGRGRMGTEEGAEEDEGWRVRGVP